MGNDLKWKIENPQKHSSADHAFISLPPRKHFVDDTELSDLTRITLSSPSSTINIFFY